MIPVVLIGIWLLVDSQEVPSETFTLIVGILVVVFAVLRYSGDVGRFLRK